MVSVLGVAIGDDDQRRIRGFYGVAPHRTIEQDPGFGIRQIVDIALKAISPGINDVTTAAMCIDRLTEILVRLADRRIECRRDHGN